MATMIPNRVYSPDVSLAERDIFARLKDDPDTDGWIVLHSLDIAKHRRQVSGEIDFVVIVPGRGVVCIEAKGCHSLRRVDGRWFYGNSEKGDARGPFKQASEAMHSLRESVTKRQPALSRVVFWSAVIFPYHEFSAKSGEWNEWQVIDSRRYRARPISALILRVIDSARRLLAGSETAGWFDPAADVPSEDQCRDLSELLRGDFEFYESGNGRHQRIVEELRYYTEEQFAVLDYLAANPRAVITGPAGTGKTVLALESVRRAVATGLRPLLLCYNHHLGGWLRDELAYTEGAAMASTLDAYLLRLSGLTVPPDPIPKGFWRGLAAPAVENLLEAEGSSETFDLLVIDEAQDILRDENLDVFDLLLAGGLGSGRWLFFGDFASQSIYGGGSAAVDGLLSDRRLRFTPLSLSVNCRNTPLVAATAEIVGALEPGYTRVLRPDDGMTPKLAFYADVSAQTQMLAAELLRLRKDERFDLDDIVVLSMRGDVHSAAARLASETGVSAGWLKPFSGRGEPAIRYCSIGAFKGLEAAAIVVTDIRSVDDDVRELLYVAVSRSVQSLVLLASEDIRADVGQMLKERGVGQLGRHQQP